MDWGGGARQGPTLVLNGHVDVVPPGDAARWTTPPFRMDVRDGRAYGRGVLDMKGPLVAGLAGLKAVLDSDVALDGSLLVHSVIGEEDGGLGTLATVLRGHTGDGTIVLEPTGLQVATAQAGALNFRLSVPGRAAHGALRHVGGDELVGVPYGSDLRHLVNAGGMPGVLFGPGDVARAHREDESVGVAELMDGARAVALSLMRFLDRAPR